MQHLTPKDRYLEDKSRAQAWYDYCATPALHEALQVALAELTLKMPADNQMEAMASMYMLKGARLYVETLLNLAERELPGKRSEVKQLIPT